MIARRRLVRDGALFATGLATLTPAARASLDKLLNERENRSYTQTGDLYECPFNVSSRLTCCPWGIFRVKHASPLHMAPTKAMHYRLL